MQSAASLVTISIDFISRSVLTNYLIKQPALCGGIAAKFKIS